MQLAHFSHAGRRRENQDSVRVEVLDGGRVLAAVADGMGGHQGGAYASRRALEVVTERVAAGDSLSRAVAAANEALNRDARHPDLAGMGTTVVGVMAEGAEYLVFNVGDSRCYRVSATGCEQLSRDHSFVADAMRDGTMTRDDAEATPWKNALTRSLGGEPGVEVDLFGPFVAEQPQVLVLCSDGVYKSLPDETLEAIVRGTPDATTAARVLVDEAFRRGSDDNLSAVVLEFGIMPRSAPGMALPPSIDAQIAAEVRTPSTSIVPSPDMQGYSRAGGITAPARLGVVTPAPVGRAQRENEPSTHIPRAPRRSGSGLALSVTGALLLAAVGYLASRDALGDDQMVATASAEKDSVVLAPPPAEASVRRVAPLRAQDAAVRTESILPSLARSGGDETARTVATRVGVGKGDADQAKLKAIASADSGAHEARPSVPPAAPRQSDPSDDVRFGDRPIPEAAGPQGVKGQQGTQPIGDARAPGDTTRRVSARPSGDASSGDAPSATGTVPAERYKFHVQDAQAWKSHGGKLDKSYERERKQIEKACEEANAASKRRFFGVRIPLTGKYDCIFPNRSK